MKAMMAGLLSPKPNPIVYPKGVPRYPHLKLILILSLILSPERTKLKKRISLGTSVPHLQKVRKIQKVRNV
jgi:hypothetical protein